MWEFRRGGLRSIGKGKKLIRVDHAGTVGGPRNKRRLGGREKGETQRRKKGQ